MLELGSGLASHKRPRYQPYGPIFPLLGRWPRVRTSGLEKIRVLRACTNVAQWLACLLLDGSKIQLIRNEGEIAWLVV